MMKKLFYFLIILVAGFWLYGKCSHKTTKDADVLKQVRVNVKTANLRTGPGTNYDFMLDAAGVKRQVSSGTVLDVVAEKKGWYEIRLDGEATTAYIKQSLCVDANGSSGRKGGNTGKARSTSPAPVPDEVLSSPTTSADQDQPSTSPAAPPAEEVVEEMKDGGISEDEVLF